MTDPTATVELGAVVRVPTRQTCCRDRARRRRLRQPTTFGTATVCCGGWTATLAVAATDPVALVAVSVSAIVSDGETLRVPDAATVPIPWSRLTLVALLVDHVNVAAAPEAIEAGLARSVAVGTSGAAAAIGHVRPMMPR